MAREYKKTDQDTNALTKHCDKYSVTHWLFLKVKNNTIMEFKNEI